MNADVLKDSLVIKFLLISKIKLMQYIFTQAKIVKNQICVHNRHAKMEGHAQYYRTETSSNVFARLDSKETLVMKTFKSVTTTLASTEAHALIRMDHISE